MNGMILLCKLCKNRIDNDKRDHDGVNARIGAKGKPSAGSHV